MTAMLVFLSALLIFTLEPLISKQILPWYGGVSSVWTTCLLFFQAALLLGYLWAYAVSKVKRVRLQLALHIVAVCTTLFLLPVTPDVALRPRGGEDPVLHLLMVLCLTIGGPFIMLSATAPIIQSWRYLFAKESSPYWLYSVSNIGSFIGLLGYPFLIEPNLDLAQQSRYWSIGFLTFIILLVLQAKKFYSVEFASSLGTNAIEDTSTANPSKLHITQWLLLSACSSWLLVSTTNHLCRDIASIPLLWVLPLGLFLFSYVLTFATRPIYNRRVVIILFCVALSILAALHVLGGSIAHQVLSSLAALFFGCLLCNGELAAIKPSGNLLSLFFVLTAVGGIIGTVFVSLIAPYLFTDYLEYPLGFQLCAALAILRLFEADRVFQRGVLARILASGSLLLLMFVGFALTVRMGSENSSLLLRRNFFGVSLIKEIDSPEAQKRREFYHGSILHGSQYAGTPNKPTAYFGPNSGVGRVFVSRLDAEPQNVGVIGLGVGTLALYGRKGDHFTFWDINRDVIDIAKNDFTFLRQSAASIEIVEGDGRIGIESLGADSKFDILIMDAFNGDSVPLHLLTREAIEYYLIHLRPKGLLVFQISNLYLDLKIVLANVATDLNLQGFSVHDLGDPDSGTVESEYVILSKDGATIENPAFVGVGQPLIQRAGFRTWTDSYASLWKVVK